MNEKTLTCNQCGKPFILTVGQQERISDLGFDEPKQCRDCREKKIIAGLSRHEENMRHKNVDIERQWQFMYNIRKKRDALLVSGNESKSFFKDIKLISMMEDDDVQ